MSQGKRKQEGAAAEGGGRSLRARQAKRYADESEALLECLQQMESYDTLVTRHQDEGAARTVGLPPYELADFERTCRALPDSLRRRPDRLCTLRNHILARAQRHPAQYLTLSEALKGLDSAYRGTPTPGSKAAEAAGVYECLLHHGHINSGVIDDHPRLPAANGGRPARATVPSGGARHVLVVVLNRIVVV